MQSISKWSIKQISKSSAHTTTDPICEKSVRVADAHEQDMLIQREKNDSWSKVSYVNYFMDFDVYTCAVLTITFPYSPCLAYASNKTVCIQSACIGRSFFKSIFLLFQMWLFFGLNLFFICFSIFFNWSQVYYTSTLRISSQMRMVFYLSLSLIELRIRILNLCLCHHLQLVSMYYQNHICLSFVASVVRTITIIERITSNQFLFIVSDVVFFLA